ncbi:MAG TPA: hypothetical protein VFG03_17485, partial [Telluria sp.]|nr:hypothetical protein [Telluria sp.]
MSQDIDQAQFFWALQALCLLHRKSFSLELAKQQVPAPFSVERFAQAAGAFGLDAVARETKAAALHKETFPLVAWMLGAVPALVLQATETQVLVLEAA